MHAETDAELAARCRTQTCADLLMAEQGPKLTRSQRLEQWRERRKRFAQREAQDVTAFAKDRAFQARYERAYMAKSFAERDALEEARATGVGEEETRQRVERAGRVAFDREVAAIDREVAQAEAASTPADNDKDAPPPETDNASGDGTTADAELDTRTAALGVLRAAADASSK